MQASVWTPPPNKKRTKANLIWILFIFASLYGWTFSDKMSIIYQKISDGVSIRATKANMKTSQLALTLVLLALQGSKAGKVTSCLQCTALESDCAAGTGKGR